MGDGRRSGSPRKGDGQDRPTQGSGSECAAPYQLSLDFYGRNSAQAVKRGASRLERFSQTWGCIAKVPFGTLCGCRIGSVQGDVR